MLASSYPKFRGDGTAPFVEEIARGVARAGHAVDVVLPRHPDLVTDGRSDGLALRLIPFWAGPARRYAWGYASSMQADRALRPKAVALAPLVLASALHALTRELSSRRYDLVHVHWMLPNGPVAAIAAKRVRLPLVVSLHGSDVFVAERHGALRPLARWVLRSASWCVACSRDLAMRAVALDGPSLACEVIPYGVDATAFGNGGDPGKWRHHARAADGEFLVAGLGRLVAKKGFSHLLRAVGKLRREGVPIRLALGGIGDLAAALAAEAEREGSAEAVHLVGNVPHDEVGAFLRAADAVVVPSVRDERGNVDGLPNVLLEALAAGRPIVATRIGGIPDVIDEGRNGILVEPGDANALAAALRRLWSSPEERAAFAANARETALSLSWARYGERLLAGYDRVLRRPSVAH